MAKKKPCKYTENQERLKLLLVCRSVEKTERYNAEIEKLQSEINFFEYGVKPSSNLE